MDSSFLKRPRRGFNTKKPVDCRRHDSTKEVAGSVLAYHLYADSLGNVQCAMCNV